MFFFCMINKREEKACDDYFFKHKAKNCSLSKLISSFFHTCVESYLDSMRIESIVKVSFAIVSTSKDSRRRKSTRAFIKDRENDTLKIIALFSLRRRRQSMRRFEHSSFSIELSSSISSELSDRFASLLSSSLFEFNAKENSLFLS